MNDLKVSGGDVIMTEQLAGVDVGARIRLDKVLSVIRKGNLLCLPYYVSGAHVRNANLHCRWTTACDGCQRHRFGRGKCPEK